ncbi:MAG TPA: type IV pilin protein [Steroidobacteraceae bacterium]|nr:type IV pilin protein [Steroidobacteraceae bacterium]
MRHKQIGVTLMELLTVLVIISILSAIAIPSYRQYTIRANRTDAKTGLLFYAGALERCYTRYNSYVYNADPAAGCNVLGAAQLTENGRYLISISNRTATTFLLTATPQGKQADDTGCGNFTLDQVNTRSVSGSKPVAECWGK